MSNDNNISKREEFGRRLKLCSDVSNMYFQPPSDINMKYPCIVYKLKAKKTSYANNKKYINKDCYTVIVIDKNVNSCIPEKVESMKYSSFKSHYVVDNLNHWEYEIYI